MMSSVKPREKGFTLIEALVALVIISVSLLALGAFTITVLSTDNVSVQRHVASNVAVEQIEVWPDVINGGTTTRNNVKYTWATTIDTSGPINGLTGTPGTRTVTVSWTNKGKTYQVIVTGMKPVP